MVPPLYKIEKELIGRGYAIEHDRKRREDSRGDGIGEPLYAPLGYHSDAIEGDNLIRMIDFFRRARMQFSREAYLALRKMDAPRRKVEEPLRRRVFLECCYAYRLDREYDDAQCDMHQTLARSDQTNHLGIIAGLPWESMIALEKCVTVRPFANS